MKKLIAIVLAVVLVAGGLGGLAYAQNGHQPMTGQKLVATSSLGSVSAFGGLITSETLFVFTNADCVSEITIEQISIIKGDGTVVYEGPLCWQTVENGEVVDSTPVNEPMKPHEVWIVNLTFYMPNGEGGWLSVEEAWSLDSAQYTLEIFWTGSKDGCPLTGYVLSKRVWNGDHGNADLARSPMVNMEQVLEPAKEKEVTVLRLQTWLQPDDSFMEPLENFANTVNSQSDLVEIQLYPAAPIREIAEAVRRGDMEMGLVVSVFLQDSPSLMDAPQLPFLYNSEDGLMAAVQAGVGDLMSEQIKDMTVLDWTTFGFSHLFSRDMMLDEPGEVNGLKIRAMGIQVEAIEEWGGTPVLMPLAEIYKALEEKKIHGAILSPSLYVALNLYELQQLAPYFYYEGYAFGNLAGLCINDDVWKSLDENTQQIITEAVGAYVDEMLATVKSVDAAALDTIRGYGVEVKTLTSEERAAWRQASQPVWDSWLAEAGDVGQQIIDIALMHNPLP